MNLSQSAKKLHTINRMFALITGSNRIIADHVSSAINFSMGDTSADIIDEFALDRFAQQLITFYKNAENKDINFAHCDYRYEEYNPLWLREKLIAGIDELIGYPKGILLVTGVRQLVCPKGKRWTQKRQSQYEETIEYMEEIAVSESKDYIELYLLFV